DGGRGTEIQAGVGAPAGDRVSVGAAAVGVVGDGLRVRKVLCGKALVISGQKSQECCKDQKVPKHGSRIEKLHRPLLVASNVAHLFVFCADVRVDVWRGWKRGFLANLAELLKLWPDEDFFDLDDLVGLERDEAVVQGRDVAIEDAEAAEVF